MKKRYFNILIPLICSLYLSSCQLGDKVISITPEILDEETISIREGFDVFCDDFFIEYLGSNAYYWNVYTINSQNFGYQREDDYIATYQEYHLYTEEEKEELYNLYNTYLDYLYKYDYNKLSDTQQISYDYIAFFLEKNSEYYNKENGFDDLIDLNYIDSYGGSVADFDSMIKEYKIYSELDLIDINNYIKSTKDSFLSYYTYACDRIEYGYPLSDTTLDNMISFLDEIISQGKDYYLYDIIENKIEASSLEDSKKTFYKEEITTSLSNYYLKAVESLSSSLITLKGNCIEEGYYQQYGTKAQDAYKFNLEYLLGYSNINMDDYINEIEEGLNDYLTEINKIIIKLYYSLSTTERESFLEYENGTKTISNLSDPNDIIDYLKEFSTTIVPQLQNEPEISFSYMDEGIGNITTTVAYYLKSPLDNTLSESITLNGKYLNDDLDELLSTIAHEGYPGHLYEYCYLKELGLSNIATILTNTGHGEGWACYVQEKLYDYIKDNTTDKGLKLYCDYSKYNFLLSYLLYTRIDVGINYEGWTILELEEYLSLNGYNKDIATDLFETLIEMPTTYAAYGYGSLKMHNYHISAKNKLGKKYDEVEFNKIIMSCGWVGYEKLDKVVRGYIYCYS